jgi:hypothetical protein
MTETYHEFAKHKRVTIVEGKGPCSRGPDMATASIPYNQLGAVIRDEEGLLTRLTAT